VDGLHDAVADFKYRVTLSPGAGYYFIKETNTTLSGEVGPGVIFERLGTNDHTYMTLRLAEKFEHKFSDRVRLWQSLEFLPQVDKFNNWILNAEVGVETKMSAKLGLRVFALDTYDNQPAPGRKKNDLKLVTALAYHF
jgi:putative salt-induced outer membrane protein YdiY